MHVLSWTCQNSGSRSPFDTLTSALDRTFCDSSIEYGFRASTLFNNSVLESEILQNWSEKVAGVWQLLGKQGGLGGRSPPNAKSKIQFVVFNLCFFIISLPFFN